MATQDTIDDGRLIELYREEENLWDTTNAYYFNRDKKRESILHIAAIKQRSVSNSSSLSLSGMRSPSIAAIFYFSKVNVPEMSSRDLGTVT